MHPTLGRLLEVYFIKEYLRGEDIIIWVFVAPFSQAKSKGFHSKYDMGVKYAEKQQRRFAPEKLREGRNIIGLQVRKCSNVLGL